MKRERKRKDNRIRKILEQVPLFHLNPQGKLHPGFVNFAQRGRCYTLARYEQISKENKYGLMQGQISF